MKAIRILLTPIVRLYLRSKYEVTLNGTFTPQKGPCIYISNHPALLDTLFHKCFVHRELTVCGAKPVYFSSPKKRLLMRLGKIIQVTDEQQYLSDCQALLQAGEQLLIYPEMGRNYPMGAFKDWAAKVALKANCPIIPLHIRGTERSTPASITLGMGTTITPTDFRDAAALTQHFHTQIRALS